MSFIEDLEREIEQWIRVTGCPGPDDVTYTQEEAHYWRMKAEEYGTVLQGMQPLLRNQQERLLNVERLLEAFTHKEHPHATEDLPGR